jgi:hypothetical protein
MVQKSPPRLLAVGLLMLATLPLAFLVPRIWWAELVLLPTGAYLVVWAVVGRGGWCRHCKKFSVVRPRGR